MKYLQVQISAENREQADKILNALLESKLVTGGQIITAPAKFFWKGKIQNSDYCAINSYTIDKNKKAIVSVVKAISTEEVPMITFVSFEGNEEMTKWIDQTLS